MLSAGFDPRRVQYALVCMLFDPDYAAAVRSADPLPELSERERELLRDVDPRALATDDMRRARALHVLLDEYPVSAALLGVDEVDRYFGSAAFRACVFERGSMALGFGERFLDDRVRSERVRGVGAIETGLARARRGQDRGGEPGWLVRAAKVVALTVPERSLAWYQRALERLAPEPLRALASLPRPWPQRPPRHGQEPLLIEAQPDGSLGIALASRELVELIRAAEHPGPRGKLAATAIELGAEPADAEELLDELIADGLLRTIGPER